MADRLFEQLEASFFGESCVIHSNKTQNYRLRSIEQFENGENRILIATDVMARGLDIDSISHVINFDTPDYPENYMHRIGRTGRAEKQGHALVFTTEKELEAIENIEELMQMKVPVLELPKAVELSTELIEEERPQLKERYNPLKRKTDEDAPGPAFHEKKDKNKKENLGGSYRREIAKKYKKPKTRGDKNYNRRNKRK
jgi:ATP-dependent RNA helicase RhlE